MEAQDYSSALLASSVLMMALTTMAIVMRLAVRLGVLGGLGWDDVLVGTGWVFAMVLYATTIAARQYGFGMHLDLVPANDQTVVFKLILVCSVAYSCSGPAVKAAFCILCLRILRGRTLALLNKCLITFFAAQAIEECLTTFAFNLSTELFLFLQPIPTVWHLQVPVAKRIAVIVMLSLGLLVCIISVIRMVYVTKIGSDTTYDHALPMIWSQVEVSALIFCSCIPYSRQVVQRIPWLGHLVGLHAAHHGGHAGHENRDSTGSPNHHLNTNKSAGRSISLALQKRLQGPGFGGGGGVVGVPLPSQVESTDEIFPQRPNRENQEIDLGDKDLVAIATAARAIVVTHDITYEYEYEYNVKDARISIEESPGARTIVYTGESSDDEDEDNNGDDELTIHASDDSSAEYKHKDEVVENV
ncbi:MAG: hypothetical protein STHCBS139747_001094 [Sporothrix thermara]